jgi:tetratricopeptide (TPR) repeat protein
VDTAGYSCRALEHVTSEGKDFFSKSQWGRWLNGQSLPPRRAVRKLIERFVTDEVGADHLINLWDCAFVPPNDFPQEAAVPGSTRPRQLPITPLSFVGRGVELEYLTHLAENAGSGTLVVVLEGMAGVGKTTLALHLAHQIKHEFRDGQLFVNLRGFDPAAQPVATESALHEFLESLGTTPGMMPTSPSGRAALYRSLLTGKRVLVVLDNAHDPDQVRGLLPASSGCLVLITSRNQMTGLIAEGAHLLPLDPFSSTEAHALLADQIGAARAGREPDAAADLIDLCARLPLALSVAGAYVAAHPQFALSEIAREFRGRRLDLLDTGDPATSARSVFTCSYRRLTEPGARLFRLLGIHPGPDVGLPAAAILAGLPVADTRKALAELTRASLLIESAPGRFAFHDLLRAYAAELADGIDSAHNLAAAERRLLDYYLRTTYSAVRGLYPTTPTLPVPAAPAGAATEAFKSYEDAKSWLRGELHVLLATVIHAAAGAPGFDAYCWQMPVLMANPLERGGRVHDYLECQRIGLAAAERLGDPEALGNAHSGFAYSCAMYGDTETSRAHLDQALEAFTAAGDQGNVARIRSRLAMLLEQQGQYAEALRHGREALRLRRAFGNRAAIAHSENVVGWLYARLGQHAEGLRHCKRGLEMASETGARALTADILDSLGMITLAMGEHEQALSWYQQALAAYRENGDSRGTFSALSGIGDVRFAAGQSETAADTWRRALAEADGLASSVVSPVQARLARVEALRAMNSGRPSSRELSRGRLIRGIFH